MTRSTLRYAWPLLMVGLLFGSGLRAPLAQPGGTPAPGGASGSGQAGAAATNPGGASSASGPAAAASAPPVSVTVVPARQKDLPVLLEATGTAVPMSSVDVRSQVTSVVTQVHVKEGQFVKAGDPLFTLDARADEANVAKLQAQVVRDEATLADARRQLARSRELLAQNFVSQGAVDSSQTLVDAATALVAADRAAVEAAKVPLTFAKITAPTAGRAGVINIFKGSAVIANQTSLVTITQLDPIDVAFNVPQRYLGDVLQALKSGSATVTAELPDGGGSLSGKLQFVDNAIDGASGTIKVKARFSNKDSKLWPGAFVKASLTLRTLKDAVVVPQAAIIQSPRGTIVYAVQGGKAVLRPIQVQGVQGEMAAISGVKPGEKIVLDGRQNLRPGVPVIERPRDGGPRSGAGAGARAASGAASGSRGGAGGGDAPSSGGSGSVGASEPAASGAGRGGKRQVPA